jgi:hypothetical protein
MTFADLPMADLLGVSLGLLFTLAVFSFVLGDNFLFRIAISIFIGVAAGFAVSMVWNNVLRPQLVLPLLSGSRSQLFYLAIPLGLSVLLLMKISPRFSRLGNPTMAYLVGVGVATAIGGAIKGTIFPQVGAAVNTLTYGSANATGAGGWWKLIEGGIILVGTVSTLAYFHFSVQQSPGQPARRSEIIEWIARLGQIFIAISFAALIAGVFSASLTALIERVNFIWQFLARFR